MSAASLATSTAVSTEMPTSAACRAGASLIPSPRKPTTWPRPLERAARSGSSASGETRAKTVVRSATAASARVGHAVDLVAQRRCAPPSRPTCAQTCWVTSSLSPVRILTSTPSRRSARERRRPRLASADRGRRRSRRGRGRARRRPRTRAAARPAAYATASTRNPSTLRLAEEARRSAARAVASSGVRRAVELDAVQQRQDALRRTLGDQQAPAARSRRRRRRAGARSRTASRRLARTRRLAGCSRRRIAVVERALDARSGRRC